MQVRLSRHSKRKANLYAIPEAVILEMLGQIGLPQGHHEIIQTVEGFIYPLKIIVAVEDDIMTVITNYPLKKGLRS